MKDATVLMSVDLVIKLFLSSYFTSVVYRWSKQAKDGYERV